MRSSAAVVAIVVAASSARAQPTEPPRPTFDEQAELDDGELGAGQIAVSATAALVVGFGVGHAIEGRYRQRGWMFTVGDSVALVAALVSLVAVEACVVGDAFDTLGGIQQENCGTGTVVAFAVSSLVFAGLRIWEATDTIVGGIDHNTRVHELRRRYGYPGVTLAPYIGRPQGTATNVTAGLTLRF